LQQRFVSFGRWSECCLLVLFALYVLIAINGHPANFLMMIPFLVHSGA
jgi:hypothetical protein